MSVQNLKLALNFAAAVAAFLAAALWWFASIATVDPKEVIDAHGMTAAQITATTPKGKHYDPIKTALRQGEINKWAAISAGISAFLQGVGLLIADQ